MFLQLKFFVTLAAQLGLLSFLSVILEQLGAGRGEWMFFLWDVTDNFFPTTPLISTSICLPAGYKSIGCQCIDEPSIRVMLTTFLTLYVKNSRILLPQNLLLFHDFPQWHNSKCHICDGLSLVSQFCNMSNSSLWISGSVKLGRRSDIWPVFPPQTAESISQQLKMCQRERSQTNAQDDCKCDSK